MKFRTIFYLFVVIIALISCSAEEDPETTGDITGVVRDAVTNDLISGVSVAIANIASTETNSNGQYTFEDLEPNTYEVHFIKDGYEDNVANISVTAGQTTQADVQLQPVLPELEISVTELDFGEASTSLTFSISNSGSGELTWNISEQIFWLSLSPNSGAVTNQSTSVTVTVDRTGLTAGYYQETLTVGSNGGSANIDIFMTVTGPVLTVSTTNINFGTQNDTETFILSNTGIGDLIWQASDNQTWITVFPDNGTVASGNQVIITVTIDRSIFEPGNNYYGLISIIATNATGSAEISIVATEPAVNQPLLTAYPVNFNFLGNQTDKFLHIQNNGTGSLDWQINYNEDWLEFSQTTGSTASGVTDDITITVDRNGLAPGTYSDEVSITSNGGDETINIEMEVLEEIPELSLSTTSLDFGTGLTTLTFDISNVGAGSLEWSLSATQTWIDVDPSSGIGDDTVTVTVDRTGLGPDTYNGSINVTSNGGNDQISVSMEVEEDPPVLNLSTTSLDFGTDLTTLTFDISNVGAGSLEWSLNTSEDWIDFDPSYGTGDDTITVTVDRTGLGPDTYNGSINVTSNGGNDQISVSMEVEEEPPVLNLSTTSLDFGTDLTTLTFDISNTGGGSLEWSLDTTEDWIDVDPSSGIGVETVTVTVNRTGLGPDIYNGTVNVTSSGGNDAVNITMEVVIEDNMIFIQGGTFQMGDHFNEGGADELPVHTVTLDNYIIGKYEITQMEYEAIMSSNPSNGYGEGDNYPVYYVSWYNAVTFCNLKSQQEDLTPCYDLNDWSCDFSANGYRLPTEAEWEYAARGGVNHTDNYRYSGCYNEGDLVEYAWYAANNNPSGTKEVGTRLPNQLGLYDMSGNVWEWCNDWYDNNYYSSSPTNNPIGPSNGTERVSRGGAFGNPSIACRVACRIFNPPYFCNQHSGFRIVRR